MDDVIRINDLVVAPEVVETIICLSAEKVEGVAAVGQPSDISGVISFFSQRKAEPAAPAVTVEVRDGKLEISIHLAVLFGFPFVTLAESVREEVAAAVSSQVGLEVSRVNVFIDSLLFPKE